MLSTDKKSAELNMTISSLVLKMPRFCLFTVKLSVNKMFSKPIHGQIFPESQTTLQFGEISITCKENISGYVNFKHSLYLFGNKSNFQ